MLRQPVRGLKFQRFEVSENSSWIKFHGPEIFLVDRFEMDEKCRKCRKNKFPRSDRYGWVMMFIDLVPIWKQFRTIFETSVLILEKHTPDKIHESETGRPFFSYPIIGMQMHATNTKMSTMYPTFVSVIAEFTDKLNLTYLYIYIIIFLVALWKWLKKQIWVCIDRCKGLKSQGPRLFQPVFWASPGCDRSAVPIQGLYEDKGCWGFWVRRFIWVDTTCSHQDHPEHIFLSYNIDNVCIDYTGLKQFCAFSSSGSRATCRFCSTSGLWNGAPRDAGLHPPSTGSFPSGV